MSASDEGLAARDPAIDLQARITEECLAYAPSETLEVLAGLTTKAYQHILDGDPGLHDGVGNCWIVAACAHGVAQALGLCSKLYGGQAFNEAGEAIFTSGGHYWCVVNKDIVVEAPNEHTVMIWPRDLLLRRLVPLKTSKPGMANMRKARGLIAIVNKVREAADRELLTK